MGAFSPLRFPLPKRLQLVLNDIKTSRYTEYGTSPSGPGPGVATADSTSGANPGVATAGVTSLGNLGRHCQQQTTTKTQKQGSSYILKHSKREDEQKIGKHVYLGEKNVGVLFFF